MKLYNNLLADFEEMPMGYSAIGIIASSCLGSVAAMLILMQGHEFLDMLKFFVVVSVCMGFNAIILAQFKPKIILNSLMLSLAVSSIFLLINII
ncbi:MAG TPA: hypothetical protein VIM94_08380 [Salegentibacter sp.]|uniref:hypothetical protein n=1 Tax=Salegentibacter sp. TaxID=1903072 RepID=UPI002F92CD3C